MVDLSKGILHSETLKWVAPKSLMLTALSDMGGGGFLLIAKDYTSI